MHKHIFTFLSVLILTISNHFYAWNYVGHEIISEIAYTDLPKDKQQKLDAILDDLINILSNEDKRTYKKLPYSLSKLAKLSILPDYWKRKPFGKITDQLKITDKNLTQNIPDTYSGNWHYRDQPVLTKKNSKKVFDDDGKLDIILNQFISNIKKTEQPRAKALGIIYITHLLEDAHQPLHAMSKSNDKGGNKFCLSYKAAANSCHYNLHQYWDSAGKSLFYKYTYGQKQDLINSYPKNLFHDKINMLAARTWLNESFNYWPMVYNTRKNKFPNKNYKAKTMSITQERMVLAGYRLSKLLSTIIN